MQPPQKVHAIGKIDGSYFVVANGSGFWVNVVKEVASRITGDFEHDVRLGVKESQESIELTEKSIIRDIPYAGGVFGPWGGPRFAQQTVTASRMWMSPNGETWYYIHTWLGPKWVRP